MVSAICAFRIRRRSTDMSSSTGAPPYWPRPPLVLRRNAAQRAADFLLVGSAGLWRGSLQIAPAIAAGRVCESEREEAAMANRLKSWLIFRTSGKKQSTSQFTITLQRGIEGKKNQSKLMDGGKRNQSKLMRFFEPKWAGIYRHRGCSTRLTV